MRGCSRVPICGSDCRAHVDVDPLRERGQRLADQLGDRRARHVERLRQLLEARAGEIDRADRPQHVVGRAHDADRDDLAHAVGSALDADAHAIVRVLDDRARQHRLAARRDRVAAPAHVARVGEHLEQAIELLAAERTGAHAEDLIGE